MRNLSLVLMLVTGMSLNAQMKLESVTEIDLNDGLRNLKPFGKENLLLYGPVKVSGKNNDTYQISQYNKAFELIHKAETELPEKYQFEFSGLSADNSQLSGIYFQKDKEFSVFHYDGQDLKVKTGLLEQKFVPLDYAVMGNRIFISGYVKLVGKLLVVNTETAEHKLIDLPGEGAFIKNFTVDEKNNKIGVVYHDSRKAKVSTFHLAFYNADGELLGQPVQLAVAEQYIPITGAVTWLNESDFILCGSYGLNSFEASGVYFSKFVANKQEFITYNAFTGFSNFFTYLTEGDQEKIGHKIERIESQGKKAKVDCQVEIHPVQVVNDAYLFIGEIFYPTERAVTYQKSDGSTYDKYVFDGYQYSHAVVAGFDDAGKLVFDECIKMFLDYKPSTIVKNIATVPASQNGTAFYFSTGNKMRGALLKDGKIVERQTGDRINEDYQEQEQRKLTGIAIGRCVYWYDNVFVVSGFKTTTSTEDDDKNPTFFLSRSVMDLD